MIRQLIKPFPLLRSAILDMLHLYINNAYGRYKNVYCITMYSKKVSFTSYSSTFAERFAKDTDIGKEMGTKQKTIHYIEPGG